MFLYINIWLLIVYISLICLSTSSIEPSEIQIYTNSLRTSNLSTSESIQILSITDRISPLTQTTQPSYFSSEEQIGRSLPHVFPNIMAQQLSTTPKPPNPITVTLTTDPRIHLKDWSKSVHKAARAMIPAQDLYGGLSLVCTNAAWSMLRQNILTSNTGVITTRDRPVYKIPTAPKPDDTPAVRQVWKKEKSEHDAAASAESALVGFLLDSVGPTNLLHLEEGGTDLLDLSAREICESMIAAHGILTLSDLVELRKPLSEPLTNSAHFLAHANQARLVHVRLKAESAPYLQVDQYRLFKETLTTLPEFLPYDIQYDIQFPLMTQKSLASYVTFLTPHLPAIQARAASNPFAGSSAVTDNDITNDDQKINQNKNKQKTTTKSHTKKDKRIAALTAQLALTLQTSSTKTHTNNTTPSPHPITPQHSYCYHHGYSLSHGHFATGGQRGGVCKVMEHNPTDFTHAMTEARSPTDCQGGSTNVQKPYLVSGGSLQPLPLPSSHLSSPPPPKNAPKR